MCVLETGDFKEDSEALTLGRVSPPTKPGQQFDRGRGGRMAFWAKAVS